MKQFIYILLSSAVSPLYAQTPLPVKNATEFEIATKQETIRFIRIDQDTTVRKPVLLFVQGSLPYPLIVTEGDQSSVFYLNQCDFDYESISKQYAIILIAKPHTPVVADVAELNSQWQFIPDPAHPDRFDPKYLANDLPERYVERAQAVLKFIRKQSWADPRKIVVMGHSQGANIAASIAANDSDIYAVGYFCGNPMGRFAELINAQQNAAKQGRIPRSEAQQNIERLYAQWRHICRDRNTDSGDPAATWISFSPLFIGQLTSLPMPLYIAYGTDDPGSQSCVFLPVYLELASKHNYRIRAFEGRGHNFETINSDGSSNYNDIQWKQAIEEFLAWCQNPE